MLFQLMVFFRSSQLMLHL